MAGFNYRAHSLWLNDFLELAALSVELAVVVNAI
jgi:hypothetical protein